MMTLLMGLSAFAIDGMLAALPLMATDFHLSPHQDIKQMIFFFLLGFGSMQILFGFLADVFGRKKVLIWGIMLYIFASWKLSQSHDFYWALWYRFLQGMGLSAPRVIAHTIVRDVASGAAMAKLMSYISMTFIAIPIIAPTLGYWILHYGGWRSIFLVYLSLGILTLIWVMAALPETLSQEQKSTLSFHRLRHNLSLLFHSPQTLFYMSMIAVLYAMLASYLGQAEAILQSHVYQLGAQFTYVFAISATGIIGASYLNSRLVMRYGLKRLIRLGLFVLLANSSLFLICTLIFSGKPPLIFFIVVLMLHFMAQSATMTNLNALVMEPYAKISGTASALIGSIMIFGGVAIAQISNYFFKDNLYPLSLTFCLCSLFLLLCDVFAHRFSFKRSASL